VHSEAVPAARITSAVAGVSEKAAQSGGAQERLPTGGTARGRHTLWDTASAVNLHLGRNLVRDDLGSTWWGTWETQTGVLMVDYNGVLEGGQQVGGGAAAVQRHGVT